MCRVRVQCEGEGWRWKNARKLKLIPAQLLKQMTAQTESEDMPTNLSYSCCCCCCLELNVHNVIDTRTNCKPTTPVLKAGYPGVLNYMYMYMYV